MSYHKKSGCFVEEGIPFGRRNSNMSLCKAK